MKEKANVRKRTLSDIRDNETYIIRKLADGNCWMSQNLRIVGPRTLTSADSDMQAGSFNLPSSAGGRWANSYTDVSGKNTPHVYSTEKKTDGNFYNWYTAVAATANASSININASGSICPKNWMLPSYSITNKSYSNLLFATYRFSGSSTTDANTMLKSPLDFVTPGWYLYSGSVYLAGTRGEYWIGTAWTEAGSAWQLSISTSGIFPTSRASTVDGFLVRCVAR